MPDRQDDLNAVPDLGPFAEALKRLDPQPPDLSRDALLFAAGQASAQPRLASWVWPTVAAGFAALSLVLGAFAISPGGPVGDQVQYVYVQPPAPSVAAATRPPEAAHQVDAPAPKPKPKATSAEDLERERMLQVRRDVLRWGVDMLPEPKSAGGPGPSPDVVARELNRWLNLPPGTFTSPALQPRKPEPKDDENDQ